jgi:hypothetical protein
VVNFNGVSLRHILKNILAIAKIDAVLGIVNCYQVIVS